MRQAKAKELDNLRFKECNFEQLHFADNSFDVVFAIESLSHSQHIDKALSEAYRVLKPNGQLIVFDGFLQQPAEKIANKNLKIAAQLFTIGFAMHDFRPIDGWLKLAENIGFQSTIKEDLSNVSPGVLGGMGDVSLPNGDTVGSGDVPAGSGDAKKKKKKLKTIEDFIQEQKQLKSFKPKQGDGVSR